MTDLDRILRHRCRVCARRTFAGDREKAENWLEAAREQLCPETPLRDILEQWAPWCAKCKPKDLDQWQSNGNEDTGDEIGMARGRRIGGGHAAVRFGSQIRADYGRPYGQH